MSWRLAGSLAQLRIELDTLAPSRSKASDGTIGDTAHASRASRHNPNRAGVVCALDVTDDPNGGCPIHVIADQVRTRPHPNLAYIISDGRVAGRSTGWRWHTYTGSNKHTKHAHFAVGVGPDGAPADPYDDTASWGIANATSGPAPGPAPAVSAPASGPRTLSSGMRGDDVSGLQKVLIGAGLLPAGSADGVFGPRTEAATIELQRQLGVTADGRVGPETHAAIARLLVALAPPPFVPPNMAAGPNGAADPRVRQFQERLRQLGHDVAADGLFGPATRAAVIDFQRTRGLGADGVVGPATWKALWS